MAPSGTYAFFPSTGELISAAYRRIQIHRSEILQEHLLDARMETNLMQARWSNLGPTLWTIDQVSVPLTGALTYPVDAKTVMILDAWLSTPVGGGTSYSDRVMTPISRTEWASTPNKTQTGSPTSFWFDRLESPTITLWPVDDGSGGNVLNYYRFSQMDDATLAGAATPDTPYLWLDAWVAGLAYRLAMIYKPDAAAMTEVEATKAYAAASMQGVENVPTYIAPQTQGYWRT